MPRNKNPEETVQKILDASLALFIKKGFDRTTINDIVGELDGMTRGAFYHHFESKKEVLYALLGKKFERLELDYADKSLNGLEQIQLLMINGLAWSGDEGDDQIMRIMIDLLKDPTALSEQVKENQSVGSEWLQNLVEIGIADGSIKQQDPKSLTELILLLLNFWIIPTVYPVETISEFESKILLIKTVLYNLGCPIIDDENIKSIYGLAKRFDV